jgi:hypothetical protein
MYNRHKATPSGTIACGGFGNSIGFNFLKVII